MSIVKHKRGSAPEVSARRVAELKALAENQMRRLITAIFLPRTMNSGQGRCEGSSIDHSKLRHLYALTPM